MRPATSTFCCFLFASLLAACSTTGSTLGPRTAPAPIFGGTAPRAPVARFTPPPPPPPVRRTAMAPRLVPEVPDAPALDLSALPGLPLPASNEAQACPGGVCVLPPPAEPLSLESAPQQLRPVQGTLDLGTVGGWTLFGRAYKRHRDFGGVGLGLERRLRGPWTLRGDVGCDPGATGDEERIVFGASLSARF